MSKKTFQNVQIPLTELMRARHACAWKGCTEATATTVAEELPADWRYLAVWWGPSGLPPWGEGNIEDRDAVLCPEHAAMLDQLLKDIR